MAELAEQPDWLAGFGMPPLWLPHLFADTLQRPVVLG
jgi:hypothetical protein